MIKNMSAELTKQSYRLSQDKKLKFRAQNKHQKNNNQIKTAIIVLNQIFYIKILIIKLLHPQEIIYCNTKNFHVLYEIQVKQSLHIQ